MIPKFAVEAGNVFAASYDPSVDNVVPSTHWKSFYSNYF